MGRNRVLSFISQLSSSHRDSQIPPRPPSHTVSTDSTASSLNNSTTTTTATTTSNNSTAKFTDAASAPSEQAPFPSVSSSPTRSDVPPGPASGAPIVNGSGSSIRYGRQRSSSRPLSMVQTYQPYMMDINDTAPELQPIFTFLNSHGNKLYHEGYFLKLDDQNSQGRPNPDRNWTECFAQLVGTVLSLWDAAELDAAGEHGEVLPKFINISDAAIKMIDSLPTRNTDEQPLQHILSVSTAGRNRYLLHFNSHHSLVQWTAAIRLAMFEQSSLQEAYTGALIAGKGKELNNIHLIMDRSRHKTEEWVRVRFGAGVPWRRCWCVITPPDEKDVAKLQKEWKKRSPYDRSHMPTLKGTINFYDTRKEGKKLKKAKPIATLSEAYSTYAIYPQSKALINASTLIKVEGTITIHSMPPTSSEGFVFIMPEVPPAVTGFEMLLRFLFPIWDTFGLYGRPGRLVASVLDTRSLMFAMPKHRHYGYLELMDVTSLILTDGSQAWTDRDWRKNLKDLTSQRIAASDGEDSSSGMSSRRNSRRGGKRLSFGPTRSSTDPGSTATGGLASHTRFNFAGSQDATARSSRSAVPAMKPAMRTDSAPPTSERQRMPSSMAQAAALSGSESRNFSDSGYDGRQPHASTPSPPMHNFSNDLTSTPERASSEDDSFSTPSGGTPPVRELRDLQERMQTPEPVYAPPAFHHESSSRPAAAAHNNAPELRTANSRLSNSTMAQLVNANGAATSDAWLPTLPSHDGRPGSSGSTHSRAGNHGYSSHHASRNGSRTDLAAAYAASPQGPVSSGLQPPNVPLAVKRSRSPLNPAQHDDYVSPNSQANSMNAPQHPSQTAAMPSGPYTADTRLPPVPKDAAYIPFRPAESGRQMPFQTQGPTPPPNPSSPPPSRMQTPPPLQVGNRTSASALSPSQASPIQRKPLPPKADSPPKSKEASEPQSAASSAASLRNYYIDEDALNKVHELEDRHSSDDDRQVFRQDTKRSEASSHYDDASSTTSPDYASTHQSNETEESVERPRAGVLRTVGTASSPSPQPEKFDIPEVNFGPTYNYAAASLPMGSPKDATPRSKTPTAFAGSSATAARPYSPSASQQLMGALPIRKAARDQQRPTDMNHNRQNSDDTIRRRSVAWQAGTAIVGTPGTSPGEGRQGAMTPEQFVMQRAAQSSTPVYSHQRNPSSNTLATMRAAASTPPLRRTSSHDLLSSMGGSPFQQQRPGSQGAVSALGARHGSGDASSHLSAREQEHLARVTGTPLISMAGNGRPREDGGAGLVGAIAAREWEKQQMKQGVSSQAVQYAIGQRQQLQFQQQQQMQQQQQHQYYMQQQQQAQMFGSPQQYGGYSPYSTGQQRMGPQFAYGQPVLNGWNMGQQGPPMAQQYNRAGMNPQQGYQQQQYGRQQYSPQGGAGLRSNTPSTMGPGMIYPGQAF